MPKRSREKSFHREFSLKNFCNFCCQKKVKSQHLYANSTQHWTYHAQRTASRAIRFRSIRSFRSAACVLSNHCSWALGGPELAHFARDLSCLERWRRELVIIWSFLHFLGIFCSTCHHRRSARQTPIASWKLTWFATEARRQLRSSWYHR